MFHHGGRNIRLRKVSANRPNGVYGTESARGRPPIENGPERGWMTNGFTTAAREELNKRRPPDLKRATYTTFQVNGKAAKHRRQRVGLPCPFSHRYCSGGKCL
jgi:hypothetical protein